MDDVVSTFPLLRLPNNAVLKTLRMLTYPQIFGISFLSKKTKGLVVSLKLTPGTFHVEVYGKRLLIMLFFRNYDSVCFALSKFQIIDRLRELETPAKCCIRGQSPKKKWTKTQSVKQLMDHLKSMCSIHSSITSLQFGGNSERFNVESIHRNVKDIERICLVSGNHEHNKRVMSVFKPASLTLGIAARVNECVPKYILIQNFNTIHVPNVQITLDGLLTTNARVIKMSCPRLSAKILNRFIKLWIKGSNPRLELMSLGIDGDFQNEELLKGLKCQDAPRNTEILFKTSDNGNPTRVFRGWDIWRLDGTRATITATRNFGSVDFKLFAWHDHCVVN